MLITSKRYPRPKIPPSMHDQLIWHYHYLSHAGIKATQELLEQRYVFTRINARMRDSVKSYVSCQRAKVGRHVISPATCIAIPTKRFSHIQVDLCKLFPAFQGFSYLFVCIDHFLKWVEAYPLPDQSTPSVIPAHGCHIQIFGTFSYMHSDSGGQFTSAAFNDYYRFLVCEHRMSNIRCPQSNDLVKRYIKTINQSIYFHPNQPT